MPLRKADSIYREDTGRFVSANDLTFFVDRLAALGKVKRGSAEANGLFQLLRTLVTLNESLPRPFDPCFLIFQTWHETGGYTSGHFVNEGNLAGIGIWADGIPSPWQGKLTPEEAVKVYLLELVSHTGTRAEFDTMARLWPSAASKDAKHLQAVWNLRDSVAWPTIRVLTQLNEKVGKSDYVWAADPLYPEKIETLAGQVAPDIPDSKGISMGVNIGNRPLRIAIGAGHRNNSGGNEFETALTAKATNEVVKLARASKGFDIRSYTPNDGLGWFDGPLDAAAATVTAWMNQGWAADILHELHFEGLGNPVVRGGFVIYPDSAGLSGRNPGDIDLDVQAVAGKMAVALVSEFGGVTRYDPPRGMSEKETGVGEQGYRLGVFGAWAEPYFINNSFRFITEAATYTNPTDLAIMQKPGFASAVARGVLQAYALIAKQRGNWTYPYVIGSAPAGGSTGTGGTPVPTNVAPDGAAYPEGFDNGIMALIFGSVKDGGKVYAFNPKGVVSTAWYSRYKANGNWPRLLWHFVDTKSGREFFGFYNGDIFWKPNGSAAFRWA